VRIVGCVKGDAAHSAEESCISNSKSLHEPTFPANFREMQSS